VHSLTLPKTARLLMGLGMLCVLASLTSCGSRTILPRKGDPVQLREDTRAKVWVFDKDGKRVESETTIPVGWYAVDAPDAKNE